MPAQVSCDIIVPANRRDTKPNAESGGRWYTNVFTIDLDSTGGDSGSPVYRPEPHSTASVTGVVHSRVSGATCMSGWDTSASKWHDIRDFWGLTLITGDAYLPVILKNR